MKKKTYFIISGIIVLFFLIFYCNVTLVNVDKEKLPDPVGIIDGNLSIQHDNVTYHNNVNFIDQKNTHGDNMLSFLFDYKPNVNVYYFNATNKSGYIDTETLINGLNWMVENSVTKVNISLSSKTKNDELQNWILEHDNMKIYSSYNNKLNTYDYPALYENVIASGRNPKVHYKDIDIKYKNDNILLINNGFKLYKGNSYLSILSMFNN